MLHRRDAMIRLGQVALGSLTLPRLLKAESTGTAPVAPGTDRAKAKACILVYLWGGPPQQDMWDLKPDAPEGIRSLFRPIDTAVSGIRICEHLPRIARRTDTIAVIRSYTHSSNVHEASVYHTLIGRQNPTLAVPRNARSRADFPNLASVVSYFTPAGSLPASVTVPAPIGHDGVVYAGTYAGFLGARHDPMEIKSPGEVDQPPPHSLALAADLDATRLQARFGLLKLLDSHDRHMQRHEAFRSANLHGLDEFREQAFRMLTSPRTKGAFDLEAEPPRLRDRYGRNQYGESFQLARRLIEAGVRLVTVVWSYICPDGNVANVWDNHGGTGSLGGITGYQMLTEPYCLPALDQAYSALLEDLADRGLLDEALVAMLGEFGRTPQINKTAGRDHWGACQSVVLAGGGIRGGQMYGTSDKHAAYPTDNPVSPQDLIATIYYALGIPQESVVRDQEGRPHRMSDGAPLAALFG